MKRYKIKRVKSVEKDILRLPKYIFTKFKKIILSLETSPRPSYSKKIVGYQNLYRLRIGPYRVVYEIDEKQKVVIIVKIAHRKDIYRKIS